MGPPRRTHLSSQPKSHSGVSLPPASPMKQKFVPPPVPQSLVSSANVVISDKLKLEHNLKVLKRRDPSIISIFDQFEFVSVYRYQESKWVRFGVEGSMFLFERNQFPPYGIYILNRNGMNDFVQLLHPEDDIRMNRPDYCVMKFYPEYSAQRLEHIKKHAPREELSDKFSDIYAVHETIPSEAKGSNTYVAFWMMLDTDREPLSHVMLRLHSYVQSNKPYPEEYRYGPGKKPPPNPIPLDEQVPSSDAQNVSQNQQHLQNSAYNPQVSGSPRGASAVDKLFSGLQPQSAPISDALSQPAKLTMQSLFASVSTSAVVQQQPEPTPPPQGIQLLNSIFASASSTPVAAAPLFDHDNDHVLRPPSAVNSMMPIYSPTPQNKVLDQDVISNLLGLETQSRSSSAAPSTTSSSRSAREADNEDESGDDPALATDPGSDGARLQTPSRKYNMDAYTSLPSSRSRRRKHGSINGVTTPRPSVDDNRSIVDSNLTPSYALEKSVSADTVKASTVPLPTVRQLIPFQDDSALWPYTSNNDRGTEDTNEDYVELDFTDTAALSDPDAFQRASQKIKGVYNIDAPNISTNPTNNQLVTNGSNATQPIVNKKNRRREKQVADRQREQAEIEKSWDIPESRDVVAAPVKGKATAGPPSHVKSNGITSSLNPQAARDGLIAAMHAQTSKPGEKTERNEFVRELLTLIHTDKSFVDNLWQEYLSRLD